MKGSWKIMRQRIDKEHPNYVTVAFSVIESINNPIIKEDFEFITTCSLK
jgi:hypothetical protein